MRAKRERERTVTGTVNYNCVSVTCRKTRRRRHEKQTPVLKG